MGKVDGIPSRAASPGGVWDLRPLPLYHRSARTGRHGVARASLAPQEPTVTTSNAELMRATVSAKMNTVARRNMVQVGRTDARKGIKGTGWFSIGRDRPAGLACAAPAWLALGLLTGHASHGLSRGNGCTTAFHKGGPDRGSSTCYRLHGVHPVQPIGSRLVSNQLFVLQEPAMHIAGDPH